MLCGVQLNCELFHLCDIPRFDVFCKRCDKIDQKPQLKGSWVIVHIMIIVGIGEIYWHHQVLHYMKGLCYPR
jgi:hypothetical protein